MHATATKQGAANAVTATEADLLTSLRLSDSPDTSTATATALVLVAPEGSIAGMAIYHTIYATWTGKAGMCLADLFVPPEYRRRRYVRLLVQAVAKEAVRLDCVSMEWLCCKDNHRAHRFYQSFGAKERDTLMCFKLDREALGKFADEELGREAQ